jgi:signal transduction histidine kinase
VCAENFVPARQGERRFTSDASHDLRSPITAMRAQLEEALMYPEDTEWLRMTKAVLAGVDRLQGLGCRDHQRRDHRTAGLRGFLDAGDSVYRGRIENRIRHGNSLPSQMEAWTTAHHCQPQPVVRAGS